MLRQRCRIIMRGCSLIYCLFALKRGISQGDNIAAISKSLILLDMVGRDKGYYVNYYSQRGVSL